MAQRSQRHDHAPALVPALDVTVGLASRHARYAPPNICRIGNPQRLEDLQRADFIVGFREGDQCLTGLNALGFGLTLKNFPIHTESHMLLWELTKQGLGIGVIIEEVGDVEPRVRVLPEMPPIAFPAWLAAHREVHTSRRVRMVFDAIVEQLGPSKRATSLSGHTKRPGKPR